MERVRRPLPLPRIKVSVRIPRDRNLLRIFPLITIPRMRYRRARAAPPCGRFPWSCRPASRPTGSPCLSRQRRASRKNGTGRSWRTCAASSCGGRSVMPVRACVRWRGSSTPAGPNSRRLSLRPKMPVARCPPRRRSGRGPPRRWSAGSGSWTTRWPIFALRCTGLTSTGNGSRNDTRTRSTG